MDAKWVKCPMKSGKDFVSYIRRGNNGKNAASPNETNCDSFQERSGSSVTNRYSCGCGCEKIQIDCQAHNCTYNSDCKCTASSIQVEGSGAHSSADTKCSTFQYL